MSPKPKSTPHRVLLSLPTELYETVSRLSSAMEKSRAELVRDLLTEQQPLLDMLAITLEQARAGQKEQAIRGLQKMTGDALKNLGAAISPKESKKAKRKT